MSTDTATHPSTNMHNDNPSVRAGIPRPHSAPRARPMRSSPLAGPALSADGNGLATPEQAALKPSRVSSTPDLHTRPSSSSLTPAGPSHLRVSFHPTAAEDGSHERRPRSAVFLDRPSASTNDRLRVPPAYSRSRTSSSLSARSSLSTTAAGSHVGHPRTRSESDSHPGSRSDGKPSPPPWALPPAVPQHPPGSAEAHWMTATAAPVFSRHALAREGVVMPKRAPRRPSSAGSATATTPRINVTPPVPALRNQSSVQSVPSLASLPESVSPTAPLPERTSVSSPPEAHSTTSNAQRRRTLDLSVFKRKRSFTSLSKGGLSSPPISPVPDLPSPPPSAALAELASSSLSSPRTLASFPNSPASSATSLPPVPSLTRTQSTGSAVSSLCSSTVPTTHDASVDELGIYRAASSSVAASDVSLQVASEGLKAKVERRRTRLLSIASSRFGIAADSMDAVDALKRAAEEKKMSATSVVPELPSLPEKKSSEEGLKRSGSVWGKLKRMASTRSVRRTKA